MTNFRELLQNISNWQTLYQVIASHHHKGKIFEQFCKFYYLYEPSVNGEYKNVWLFEEVPIDVKNKLGLAKRDHGADLVLENQEGEYSVVQCKFRTDQNSKLSWTKDKLANLFAEGNKSDYLIVFSNCSGIDKHSISKSPERLKVVSLPDLFEIQPETFLAIKELAHGKLKATKLKEPRPYQEEAIKDVLKGFENEDRGQLILPCGAGKTLVSLWIKERLQPKHALILFPSLALLRQTKKEWSENQSSYTPYLCVCSEKDIDKKSDTAETHTAEIPGRVTTDSEVIRSFLTSHSKTLIYSTYQSLPAIIESITGLDFKFDLAICDEAHKTSGNKLGNFALIHDSKNMPIKKRLYMTATPRIVSNKVKEQNSEYLEYLADMSEEAVFGKEFHRMSFKQAIDQGILVDYKIVAIGVSNEEIQNALQTRLYIHDNATLDQVANNYALEKFMNEHQCSHAITFHSSVKDALLFQERQLHISSDKKVYHVNGMQSTNERSLLIQAFKTSSSAIVTNAKCLTEGIDVPAVDTVYFCDPKNSLIDIVQAAGRALRRADDKGKKYGYIVVPIFHTDKSKIEESIDESAFKNLINVIRAMSDHDERLVEEINKIKLGKGERFQQSEHISIETPHELITIEGVAEDLKASIFSQVIHKVRVPWRKFEKAREFARGLGLADMKEWNEYCRKATFLPIDIPKAPWHLYKNFGWVSIGDWLGTNRIASQNRIFRPFDKARLFVQGLHLKTRDDWKRYRNSELKPTDIPNDPAKSYKNEGWVSWGDWLGTNTVAPFNKYKQYLTYNEAKILVAKLKIKTEDEWIHYCKSGRKPINIPDSPRTLYKNRGWVSFKDWLGIPEFIPFKEARALSLSLGLKTQTEWFKYCETTNKPENIPKHPERIYKNKGWVSWSDWLGNEIIASYNRQFQPFEQARLFVHSLHLKTKEDWSYYCKNSSKPSDIPTNPRSVYLHSGWIGWGDWLGTGRIANQKRLFLNYEEAREFVHKLSLKSQTEWFEYCKSFDKPKDIPSDPQGTYKNKGWSSWGDWLRKT